MRIFLTILGLLVLALLWTPLPAGIQMSFSGPIKAERSYGVLSYLQIDTTYQPTRLSLGLMDAQGKLHGSPAPDLPVRLGELPRLTAENRDQAFIWQQNPGEVITLQPTAETVEFNPLRLGLTIVLTLVLAGGLMWSWQRRPAEGNG